MARPERVVGLDYRRSSGGVIVPLPGRRRAGGLRWLLAPVLFEVAPLAAAVVYGLAR